MINSPPNYNDILLAIQRIDISVDSFRDKINKIQKNDDDINEIEKSIINIINDIKDIRKDVSRVEENLRDKLITINSNIIKVQKNLDVFIDKSQSVKDLDLINVINKNKLISILVTLISVLFLTSNENTRDLITKILSGLL